MSLEDARFQYWDILQLIFKMHMDQMYTTLEQEKY
jgi:hypothetical protein